MVFNTQTAQTHVHVSEILSSMKPKKYNNNVEFKMWRANKHRVLYVAGFGAVLFLLGIYLGWSGFDAIINMRIRKGIVLEEGSEALKRFQRTPFPLEFKIYLFNVTNTDDIMMGGKPVVKEIGPYVYDLYKEKPELEFLPDGTIEYNMTQRYFFNPLKSHGLSEHNRITTLNVPLLGTAGMVEQTFPMGLSFLNNAIPFLYPDIKDIFMTASVRELLWDGVLIHCNYSSGPAMPICNGMKGRSPATMVRDEETKHYTFAMFRHKNTSKEGPYRVLTGKDDLSRIGDIVEYKHKASLTNWDKNSTCTIIRGTDTTIFGPRRNIRDDLNIFVPDVCLSFSAVYVNSTTVNGVPASKYFSAAKNMASAEKVPENTCRCYKDDDGKRHCFKDGVIDATACQGAPVLFSNPHFLDAHPDYQNSVIGLKPDEDKHKTFVFLEPKTGAPLEGRKRLQMNLMVKRIHGITILANVTEGIFPILWIEEGTKLEGPLLRELQNLYHVMGLLDHFRWVLVGAGLFILAVSVIIYLKVRRLFCFSGTQIVTPVDTSTSANVKQQMSTLNGGNDEFSIATFPQQSPQSKNCDVGAQQAS